MRLEATGYPTRLKSVEERHFDAPLGSRESTRPASNGVGFLDFKDPAGEIRYRVCGNCCIDPVFSIRGDPLSRPGAFAGHEVSRNFPDQ